MKKIVIASSARFQEEIEICKKYFANKGYNVINYPKKINPENTEEYRNIYQQFFESLVEADEVFILNEDKNGITGYIGAQAFAEMSFVIVQNIVYNANKKIYLLKMPSENIVCYQEVKRFIELGWVEIFKAKIFDNKK